jgi:hypothetical protein
MAQPASHTTIVVTIDEVDLTRRFVWGYDKTKTRIQCSMRESPGGILRIPNQGELWTACRRGYVWYIDRKLDSSDEQAAVVSDMSPGDVRISGSDTNSTIDIQGNVLINGSPPSPALKVNTFESVSAFTTVTLDADPGSSVLVYLNALLVNSNLWTINGRVITFINPMGSGELVVYF